MARHTQEQPSRNEDEFFAKQDAELIQQMRAKLDKEREEAERKSHFMKCPKCGSDMKEEDRGHVKVDVCASCGGMFLDAGELELMRKVESSGAKAGVRSVLDFFSKPTKGSARK
jgi:Zn-finger nucleic acid-binding protein